MKFTVIKFWQLLIFFTLFTSVLVRAQIIIPVPIANVATESAVLIYENSSKNIIEGSSKESNGYYTNSRSRTGRSGRTGRQPRYNAVKPSKDIVIATVPGEDFIPNIANLYTLIQSLVEKNWNGDNRNIFLIGYDIYTSEWYFMKTFISREDCEADRKIKIDETKKHSSQRLIKGQSELKGSKGARLDEDGNVIRIQKDDNEIDVEGIDEGIFCTELTCFCTNGLDYPKHEDSIQRIKSHWQNL